MGVNEAIDAEAVAQALCHDHRGFPPRLRGLRGQAQAGVRGELMADLSLPPLAVLRAAACAHGASGWRRLRRRAWRASSTMATPTARAGGWSRRWARPGCSRRRWSMTAARFDVRSLCLARETLAYHDGLADFAFALQGLGSGPVSLFGTAEQKRRAAGRRGGQGDPRLRPHRAGGGLRRRGDGDHGDGATATGSGSTGRRRTSRTAASPTGTSSSPAAARRPARAASRPSSSTRTRRGSSIAERIETIAPHPLARIVFDGCRVPAANRIGGGRRRLQDRHGDARRVPLDRRRGGARLRAPRLRRDGARMSRRGRRSAERSPTSR